MSKELDQALAALAEAKPTPEAVKQLAAATIARRETPYQGKQQREDELAFMAEKGQPVKLTLTTCTICGALLQIGRKEGWYAPPWGTSGHLDWHNDQERRLRKLEETEA